MTVNIAQDINVTYIGSFVYRQNGRETFGEGEIGFTNIEGKYNTYPKGKAFTLKLNSGQDLPVKALQSKMQYGAGGAQYTVAFTDTTTDILNLAPRKGMTYITMTPQEQVEWQRQTKWLHSDFDTYIKEGNDLHLNGWTAKDIAQDIGNRLKVIISWNVPNYWVESFTVTPGTNFIGAIRQLCEIFNPIIKAYKHNNGYVSLHILEPIALSKDFSGALNVSANTVDRNLIGSNITYNTRFQFKGGMGEFNPDMWRGKTWTTDCSLEREMSWLREPPKSPLIWNRARGVRWQGDVEVIENTQYQVENTSFGRLDLSAQSIEIDSSTIKRRNVFGVSDVELYNHQVVYDMVPAMKPDPYKSNTQQVYRRGMVIEDTEELTIYDHLNYRWYSPIQKEFHRIKGKMVNTVIINGIDTNYDSAVDPAEKYTRSVVKKMVNPIEYEFTRFDYDENGIMSKQVNGRLAAICTNRVCQHWNTGGRVCDLYAGTYDPSKTKLTIRKVNSSSYESDFDFNNCISLKSGNEGLSGTAICVHWSKKHNVCTLDPRIVGKDVVAEEGGEKDWDRNCNGFGTWAPTYESIKGIYNSATGLVEENPAKKIGTDGCRFYTLGNREDCPYKTVEWKELASITAQDEINIGSIIQTFEYPTDISYLGNITLLSFMDGSDAACMSIRNLIELDVKAYNQVDKDNYKYRHFKRKVAEGQTSIIIEEMTVPAADVRPANIQPNKAIIQTEYNAPNWSINNESESFTSNVYSQSLNTTMSEPTLSLGSQDIICWNDAFRIKKLLWAQHRAQRYNNVMKVNGCVNKFEIGCKMRAPYSNQNHDGTSREIPAQYGYLVEQNIQRDSGSASTSLSIDSFDISNVTYPIEREKCVSNEGLSNTNRAKTDTYTNTDTSGFRWL